MILDLFYQKHFLKWAETGRCPMEVFESPQLALEFLDSFLSALDEEERNYLIVDGWWRCWDEAILKMDFSP